MSKNLLKRYDEKQAANRQAARIILSSPERYPGIMQDWARAVLGIVEKSLLLFGEDAA